MVRSILAVLAAIVLVAVAVPVSAEPAEPSYDIVILGHLPGAYQSRAVDINERGQVVGMSSYPGVPHGTLWDSGSIVDLGTAGGSDAQANAINNRGQVAVFGTTSQGDIAFVWERGASRLLSPLGVLPNGTCNSRVEDINDRGYAVGDSTGEDRQGWPVVWDPSGNVQKLDGVTPSLSRALAINNRNQIVGISYNEAYIWEDGEVTILPPLQGGQSIATDINNRGQAVGFSQVNDEPIRFHAVLWEADGTVIDLGTLGGSSSEAYGVNDRGQVVGYSLLLAGSPGCPATSECRHAFLWEQGEMTDLGTLTFSSKASGINNRGEVVGWSSADENGNVVEYAVKWVPSH